MKTANATVIELKEVVKDIKGKRIIDHVTLHLGIRENYRIERRKWFR